MCYGTVGVWHVLGNCWGLACARELLGSGMCQQTMGSSRCQEIAGCLACARELLGTGMFHEKCWCLAWMTWTVICHVLRQMLRSVMRGNLVQPRRMWQCTQWSRLLALLAFYGLPLQAPWPLHHGRWRCHSLRDWCLGQHGTAQWHHIHQDRSGVAHASAGELPQAAANQPIPAWWVAGEWRSRGGAPDNHQTAVATAHHTQNTFAFRLDKNNVHTSVELCKKVYWGKRCQHKYKIYVRNNMQRDICTKAILLFLIFKYNTAWYSNTAHLSNLLDLWVFLWSWEAFCDMV